jgi:hypothetical protein
VELRFSLRFKNLDIFLADFIPGWSGYHHHQQFYQASRPRLSNIRACVMSSLSSNFGLFSSIKEHNCVEIKKLDRPDDDTYDRINVQQDVSTVYTCVSVGQW